MRAQPFLQHRLAKRTGFEVAIDEGDDIVRLGLQPCAVEAEEDVQAGEGDALVAVDEAVVHGETFPQSRRLLDEVGIVAGLRAQQRGFDQAVVAHALRSAEQFELLGMDVERVVEREILHLLRQRLVDLRPALGAFGMQALHGRADLAAGSFGQAAEFVGRQHDGDVAALTLDADRPSLRHVDQFAETVLGVGGGEGFHEKRLAELADLGNRWRSDAESQKVPLAGYRALSLSELHVGYRWSGSPRWRCRNSDREGAHVAHSASSTGRDWLMQLCYGSSKQSGCKSFC